MSLFEDLRREAYPHERRSTYEGVPVLTRKEVDDFAKDCDEALWKQSLKFTDKLYRSTIRRGRR